MIGNSVTDIVAQFGIRSALQNHTVCFALCCTRFGLSIFLASWITSGGEAWQMG